MPFVVWYFCLWFRLYDRYSILFQDIFPDILRIMWLDTSCGNIPPTKSSFFSHLIGWHPMVANASKTPTRGGWESRCVLHKSGGEVVEIGGVTCFAWEATTRKNFRIQGGCLETTNSQVEDLFGFPRKWSSGVTSWRPLCVAFQEGTPLNFAGRWCILKKSLMVFFKSNKNPKNGCLKGVATLNGFSWILLVVNSFARSTFSVQGCEILVVCLFDPSTVQVHHSWQQESWWICWVFPVQNTFGSRP